MNRSANSFGARTGTQCGGWGRVCKCFESWCACLWMCLYLCKCLWMCLCFMSVLCKCLWMCLCSVVFVSYVCVRVNVCVYVCVLCDYGFVVGLSHPCYYCMDWDANSGQDWPINLLLLRLACQKLGKIRLVFVRRSLRRFSRLLKGLYCCLREQYLNCLRGCCSNACRFSLCAWTPLCMGCSAIILRASIIILYIYIYWWHCL